MDAKFIVTHRPLSDTIMAWVDVEMSDDDYNERVVRENIGEDILVELLKVGPSHNRTRLIFSGLQVVAAGDNPGWEAFAGIVAGDGVTSLIVEAAASRLVAEIDGIIAATVGHELLSAAEVADMMLDLRSTASAIAQAAQA